jgi:HD-GYP domain-containing protein (c-di-GMP phosphodiesterase class II)
MRQWHDVGKLAVPDDILRKPGPLTPDEEAFIRQHTIVGERILSAAPVLQQVAALVRSTHEHWDGTGYPDGLVGDAIPVTARIVAASDAYTAMRETRALPRGDAGAGGAARAAALRRRQFDPQVVAALVAVIAQRQIAAA